jgi:hypothetical protein
MNLEIILIEKRLADKPNEFERTVIKPYKSFGKKTSFGCYCVVMHCREVETPNGILTIEGSMIKALWIKGFKKNVKDVNFKREVQALCPEIPWSNSL